MQKFISANEFSQYVFLERQICDLEKEWVSTLYLLVSSADSFCNSLDPD